MERYGGGAIVVRDYDLEWPRMFEQERARLQGVLGSVVTAVEHVGSTAVPGLSAKPIIDLLVGVESLTTVRASCVERLEGLGYTYVPEYESWLPGELFFRKGVPGPWTHHAHVMERANPRWSHLILFRDYLRHHPEVARAYGSLKKALALVFEDDIGGFRQGKAPFVEAVMAKARREQEDAVERAESPSRSRAPRVARVVSVHEYELKPGCDREGFEQAVRRADAAGLLRLPGLVAHYLVKGRKGVRRHEYAAVWIYESRAAWERLWGPSEQPRPPRDYPETWKVWEGEILAPFLAEHPDAIRFTTYEELQVSPEGEDA
jgi:GrpB-like predicted nucleotidyltransferase (UPF0157 family)